MKKYLLTTSLLLTIACYSQQNLAADDPRLFPNGCRQIGFSFEGDNLVFSKVENGQDETIYLVYNNSPDDVILETANKSKYTPSFKKTIPANHWTAFSRLDNTLRFSCRQGDHYENHDEQLNCQSIIQLCNYNNAKFPSQNLGTYWLQKTSPSQQNIMRFAIHKGILLRW